MLSIVSLFLFNISYPLCTKVTYWLAFIVRLAVELYGMSTGDIKEDVGCSYSCFVFVLLCGPSGQNQFVSYMANNTLTV
jgi:hypothetical protein